MNFTRDPAFWILIGFNLWCIYYYEKNPDGFPTIVWLYWAQSVLIGLFNFLDMLTLSNAIPGSMTFNDKPIDTRFRQKGCLAFFFLVHYGIFHLAYLVFIMAQLDEGNIDWLFVLLGVAVVALELLISFIRRKSLQGTMHIDVGKMFFLPYLRVVPMHLMILGPAFLHWEASTIFLVLKTIADVLGYFLSMKIMRPPMTPV